MWQKFDNSLAKNHLGMESTPFVLRHYLSSVTLFEDIQCTSLYIIVLLLCCLGANIQHFQ